MNIEAKNFWWHRIFGGRKKNEYLKLLQQQRLLLHKGTEATAVIIDTSFFDDKIGSLLPMRLWVKLKKVDGSFVYIHSRTIVNQKQIPGKGETVKIKYMPDNFSSILIL